MLSSQLTLVANDQRLANALQAHVQKAPGQAIRVCDFDAVQDDPRPDTGLPLLVGASSVAECDVVARLVQSCSLQQGPPVVLILAGEEALTRRKEFGCLVPY